ncbi:hypothetical protein BURK1_00514 [Burkholderiales bacterium]|nr:hypothetical protein BURK1_00514 [Burkholderiales bacterium]
MNSIRSLTLVAVALSAFAAGAQTPAAAPPDHDVHHPAGTAIAPPADPASRSAMMDEHMQAMQAMHAKMNAATTPAQRQALMAEHMALMQQGMALMGGMGPGAMGAGMGRGGMQRGAGMGAMPGGPAMPADMAERHKWMEKRMDMMQSMMQMMMDRMAAPAARP